jgi:glutathione S-transferase
MKIYDWSIAPNPKRVRMYLAEKGIDVEMVEAAEPGKPVLKPDFLDKNPHRRVPLLELDDGTTIGEAMAICRYFETLHPDPPLMGGDALEKATVEMWERISEAEGMSSVAEVFRNSQKSFAARGLPGYAESIEQIPALVERGKVRMAQYNDKIDARLAEREFLAGSRFSVADITAFCVVEFAKFCKLDIPAPCANVARWFDTVAARPSAKA